MPIFKPQRHVQPVRTPQPQYLNHSFAGGVEYDTLSEVPASGR